MTKRKQTTTQRKKALLLALEKSLGVVTTACKSVGISRTMFYNYYNKDDKFKKAVDDIQNIAIDFVESKLYEQIQNGSIPSTIFYLKTKGKNRGYVEKLEQDITHTVGGVTIVPYEEKKEDDKKEE